MTRRRFNLARFAGWVLALAAGSEGALAQAQLLMPYTCAARGGEVAIFRAPEDQVYRIFGAREEQIFSYCPTHTPDRCRNWMLFRFDVDCNGVKVPWLKIAEASVPNGQAWVEDGRMSLKVAQLPRRAHDSYSPRRRWWLERRRRGLDDGSFGPPRDIVELPPGFAPLLGTRARFEGVAVAEAEQRPAEFSHADENGLPSEAVPLPVRREAPYREPPSPTGGETAQADAPPAAPPVPLPVRRDATAAAEAAKSHALAKSSSSEKSETTAADSSAKAVNVGTSVNPTILNRPGAKTAAPTIQPPVEEPAPHASDVAQPAEPSTSTPPDASQKVLEVAAAAQSEPITPSTSALEPIATGSLQDPAHASPSSGPYRPGAATVGLVLGLVLASSLFAWSRRRERIRTAGVPRRDFADVVLERGTAAAPKPASVEKAPELATKLALAIGPPSAEVAEPRPTPSAESTESLPIPQSRAEAFEVLGASPSAAPEVVKKIVDALRQSWHPDRATSPADRHLRELKVKQINVAWDIISGKTAGGRAAHETQT